MPNQRWNRRLVGPTARGHWTFFRQWLKSPLSIAAVSPSSRRLAEQMLAELPENTRHVIELGGGTGVFTAALLDHGIEPDHLLVLELNEDLHQHLVRRFPQARVVCGDARDLPDIASRIDYGHAGKADAVLSGLGLLSMNRVLQAEIVSAAFAVLRPGGRFIQFTYGPTCPVRREVLAELGLHARRASLTWWNMPPATVYVFERGQSRQVVPTPMHRNGED